MPFMWDFFSRMLTQICVVWKKNYLFEASFSTVVPQKFFKVKKKQTKNKFAAHISQF